MKKQYKQVSLFESFSECNQLLLNDKPKFLQLLNEHLDLESFIPYSFYNSYYSSFGCHRKYSLCSMLSIFLLQKILGIPMISLLRTFLLLCKELRTIHHFKGPMACGNPKTRNLSSIKSDMLFSGIAQLITVILAAKMDQPKLIRSLKPLIA